MNTATKKICLFALAIGVADMIIEQTPKTDKGYDKIIWRAKKLREAGKLTLDKCHVKKDMNAVRKAKKYTDVLWKNSVTFNVLEVMSFLFAGLNDLAHYGADVELLEKRVLWFLKLYKGSLDDEDLNGRMMKQYEDWCEL